MSNTTIPAMPNTWTPATVPLDAYVEMGSATQPVGSGSAKMLAQQFLTGVTNVKAYGAKGDGVTNDKAAIDAAIAAKLVLYFPAGTYVYNGKMTGLGVNGRILRGDGSSKTIIKFTDNTVNSLVEVTTGFNSFEVNGLTLQGPGRASGSNIHGFYFHGSAGYNLKFSDVSVTDVSGTGFNIVLIFMVKFFDTWVERVGGNGHYVDGDQSTTFINSGQWSRFVTGAGIWIVAGAPFIQGYNSSDISGFGARFGSNTGLSYCTPTIIGMNVEGLDTAGAIGIQFEAGCNFALVAGGIQIYAQNGAIGCTGIKWLEMGTPGVWTGRPLVLSTLGTGTFTTQVTAVNFDPNNGFLFAFGWDPTTGGGVLSRCSVGFPVPGDVFKITTRTQVPGLINTGQSRVLPKLITAAGDYLVVFNSEDNVLIVDATLGNINVRLDATTSFPVGRCITVKRIDASVNTVEVNGYGTEKIDALGYVALAQWDEVTVCNLNPTVANQWVKLVK